MKIRLLVPCVYLAGLFIAACNKQGTAPKTAPAENSTAAAETPPADSPAGPTEAEKRLEQQILELEAREAELRLQMEEERLAATEAEIAKEQDLLTKEREAWRLEQELADAKAALPVPGEETLASAIATSTAPPGYDYQMFYDDLEPLGSWFESPDYGYVWQPSICLSDNSWRPYTRGRWASTDQGWTWCSDEPFGWACYHYGRWARLREFGWVWVPGDQWAPSWVAWRRNERYVGWCPLPPETVYDHDCTYGETIDYDCGIDPGSYVFVPVRHFDEPVLGYCEAPSICLTICRTTVNITNIIVRPGRVECPGPRYDWIKDRVRRPVPRYAIACEFERRPESGRRGHRREKDRLLCFTPRMRAPWNTELRPSRTAATIAGAEVVRGEAGLPGNLEARFKRERQRREQSAKNPGGTSGKILAERQQRLAGLEKTREALHEKIRLEAEAAKVSTQPEPTGGKIAGGSDNKGKFAARPGDRPVVEAGQPQEDKRGRTAARASAVTPALAIPAPVVASLTPENATVLRRTAAEDGRLAAAREELAKLRAERQSKQQIVSATEVLPPASTAENNDQRHVAAVRDDLRIRREELAKLRAGRESAGRTGAEPQPKEAATDKTSKGEIVSRAREEAARRQQEETQKAEEQASALAIRERAAIEQQQRAADIAARKDAAARESENNKNFRAALEEKRRQLEVQKEQAAQERAAIEQQRRGSDSSSRRDEIARENEKQAATRAALEERRRQLEAQKEQAAQERAAVEQQRRSAENSSRRDEAARENEKQIAARAALEERRRQQQQQEVQNQAAREQIARERAAMEQQRRQADAEARAEQLKRQREAMEQQRRNAEAEARAEQQARQQREAAEQQRRQAEAEARAEQQTRQREAMEQQRRQAEEQNRQEQQRRQAEEQNRRQAEEQNRRQAEEQSRRQADEQKARESSDRGGKGRR